MKSQYAAVFMKTSLGLFLTASVLVNWNSPASAANCGGLNQRACKVFERIPSCNRGLYEQIGAGICRVKTRPGVDCGNENQRACKVNERIPSCNGGLVENLARVCRDDAAVPPPDSIAAHWNEERVAITISDDGPGFLPSVLRSLGEPYVTTRGPAGRRKSGKHGAGGLGLGFFIAKTLLERSGAELTLTNRAQPAMGAVVGISWPRRVFEPHLAAAPASVAVS